MDDKPLCDIWVLDLDAVIYFVENPGSDLTNFWTKREVNDEQLPLLCRYGHSVEVIDYQNILIYGGIDDENYAMRQPLVYNFVTQELTEFDEEGDQLSDQDLAAAGPNVVRGDFGRAREMAVSVSAVMVMSSE